MGGPLHSLPFALLCVLQSWLVSGIFSSVCVCLVFFYVCMLLCMCVTLCGLFSLMCVWQCVSCLLYVCMYVWHCVSCVLYGCMYLCVTLSCLLCVCDPDSFNLSPPLSLSPACKYLYKLCCGILHFYIICSCIHPYHHPNLSLIHISEPTRRA